MADFILEQIFKNRIYVKYVLAGLVASAVDLFLLFVLHGLLNVNLVLSVYASFISSFFVSFNLQKFWTFRDVSEKNINSQMAAYFLIAFINLNLNGRAVYVLVKDYGVWYLWAQIIAGGCLAVISFLICRFAIFRRRAAQAEKNAPQGKKILIATGIFPPDIGGPAVLAETLARELSERGWKITVLSYGESRSRGNIFFASRRGGAFLRYCRYFFKAWRLSKGRDVILAFDITAAGFPAALAAVFRNSAKFVVRLGGDYLWESSLEKGRHQKTLEDYYRGKNFSLAESIVYHINNFVLIKADAVIFNARLLKDIYAFGRPFKKEKVFVIKNPRPKIPAGLAAGPKKSGGVTEILYIGRLIKARNLDSLIKAFALAAGDNSRLRLRVVGDGPEKNNMEKIIKKEGIADKVIISSGVSWQEALRLIGASDIVALVSLTEVNANTVAEAQAFGKPVVLTRKSEFFREHDDYDGFYYVNPLSAEDIADKIKQAAAGLSAGRIYAAGENKNTASDELDKIAGEYEKVLKE